jgi:hypothetical protein
VAGELLHRQKIRGRGRTSRQTQAHERGWGFGDGRRPAFGGGSCRSLAPTWRPKVWKDTVGRETKGKTQREDREATNLAGAREARLGRKMASVPALGGDVQAGTNRFSS